MKKAIHKNHYTGKELKAVFLSNQFDEIETKEYVHLLFRYQLNHLTEPYAQEVLDYCIEYIDKHSAYPTIHKKEKDLFHKYIKKSIKHKKNSIFFMKTSMLIIICCSCYILGCYLKTYPTRKNMTKLYHNIKASLHTLKKPL